ncbi:tyrosine--tRNA ligase [Neisseria gonorrhoeae]|uniref:Tyrosine--tRNA ligase n=16 Tax=Neisseria gonorrhoeae TaxID=485 RepID=SYY_NEIG1|nr:MULTISPECIES: tyrosine--tRNA ligase [Neisseria]B4RP13.1 RecName: Full=Tyrosine--tRNA ligase; AltName: Full=Tyrosyl-tRNA synthetase; Short=TyrRS [Neisseria gonorrhoeae NCCP11945]Q5FAF7.1 RecName: Full=Tyrosine--tRNA ligase; AltName: Full=Tyrosyl-tRNA synthetase; Short=TyrRS [Neisseria gonorrhoeae FA 1090]KLR98315.1 tyrosyl-tRNA synthetase [Neisseria gonorrhoeae SK708]KLS01203.1 tyrosyl-tRNA synthetase [Neisseria gonorrhoeae SK14515]KLS38467.1 tyrosyl-tRNA synthetase [Neisseria gonorrhoeae SK
MSVIQDLQSRGLIAQTTDIEALDALLNEQKIALYCGFDPTADSLHIGHLLPVLALRRFQQAGHTPIALVGGATGMIGDPSFKAAERSLNSAETVAGWVGSIRSQLTPFLSFEGGNAAIMANNADWFGSMNCLDFLRDIGKHFSVNAMLNKESVKQRIDRDGAGISFTEFAYSLLQGYDFAELNKRHGAVLEIGGSDQWGNITAGIDLTRRLNQKQVFGLTLPLVTKSDGTKFGKTEGGAVWLNAKKTSPYQFYQFWLKVADADVYKFLKYFTFLSIEEIGVVEAKDKASGSKPEAQRILAEEMTRLIHGEEALAAAQRISESLFAEDQSRLTESDFEQLALDGLPAFEVSDGINAVEALVKTGLAASNKEARGFVNAKAVLLNGKPAEANNPNHAAERPDDAYLLIGEYKRFGKYTILRRGKRNHALLVWK